MLAAYPEVFAGGAVIAGVPYRAAIGVPAALRCMFQDQVQSGRNGAIWCERHLGTGVHGPSCRSGMAAPI